MTAAWMLLASVLASAQSKPNPKPVTCASCHQAEAFAQSTSQMAHALQLPGSNQVLAAHPKLTYRKGAYSYSVDTHNGKSVYSVTDGTQTITLPIGWAMGAQAQTWVLERNGQMYESLVSFYPLINGLGITTGDESLSPKTLDEAVGRPVSKEEAKTCFNCHATHAVFDHNLDFAAMKAGVTCERCHTDADAHLMAILADAKTIPTPAKIGQPSTEDMSNFCGQCHRTWETAVRSHWRGEADVRFQPYRLANSRCYNGDDARISCVACHDPHGKIVRDTASYDTKCLACHSSAALAVATTSATTPHPKACPVAKSNCASCHMPKVALPNGLMKLTDHQIRVVRPNEPYPN